MFTDMSLRVETPDLMSFVPLSDDGVDKQRILTVPNVQDYNYNAQGFLINDITALNNATSVQEYNYLVNRMVEYRAQNPDNSGKSVRDMICEINPRFTQTPAELERACAFVSSHLESKLEAARLSNLARAKSSEVSSPSVGAPSTDAAATVDGL